MCPPPRGGILGRPPPVFAPCPRSVRQGMSPIPPPLPWQWRPSPGPGLWHCWGCLPGLQPSWPLPCRITPDPHAPSRARDFSSPKGQSRSPEPPLERPLVPQPLVPFGQGAFCSRFSESPDILNFKRRSINSPSPLSFFQAQTPLI